MCRTCAFDRAEHEKALHAKDKEIFAKEIALITKVAAHEKELHAKDLAHEKEKNALMAEIISLKASVEGLETYISCLRRVVDALNQGM